jgi:xanthine dehydrogenase YagR molybdenum-binding subunit
MTRFEAALKVTGEARYPGEIAAEEMLHAVLVQSPMAAGTVRAVDATRARRVAGFADVVSFDDAVGLQASSNTKLLQERQLYFAGQPVALVVGESLLHARAAASLIDVTYDERRPITTMDDALDTAFAPAMAGRIVGFRQRGAVTSALADSHLVIRQRYETATNNHHPLEPHSVVCWWDGDHAVVHTTTQAVFGTRAAIAHAFTMPVEQCRVVTRYLGGGFGCKGQLFWPWMFQAMIASKRTGRPVRLELTRAQLFTLAGRRQQTRQELAVGFGTDGRLTGIDLDVLAPTAMHAEYSDTTGGVARYLYACSNVSSGHRLIRTNEPQPIPMRAPGTAPGLFALESAIDEAAVCLGIDPVELRLRNFAERDDDADRPWSSNRLRACYEQGAERFGWFSRPSPGSALDGYWTLGSGMATTCYPAHRQPCRVLVALRADGTILVQCGTQDMGSGTYTALGQVAAEAFGVDGARVRVELGDTLLPEGPFSGGSHVTASFVPAVHDAVAQLRAMLRDLDPGADSATFAGMLTQFAPDGIEAEGVHDASPLTTHTAMGFGAIFVEVGVDTQLGEIRVRRVVAAFAAGRIINPLLAESQYVGGLIGGIGMALHERTVTDHATGRIVGDNLADYLVPVHADMPSFDIVMVDDDDPTFPGGSKGIGMLGTGGIQAAIANAVFDATGRRIRHLPIRLEDIIT